MTGISFPSGRFIPSLYQLFCGIGLVLLLLLANEIYKSLWWNYVVRKRFGDLPHIPRHWFWGNLINVGERLNPAINHHPDYAFEDVWNELGQPPAYMVDLALVDRAMLIIADPTVAEAISQPSPEYKYSIPKSDTLMALSRLVGKQSLVIINGDAWKFQRKRFNKGFAPAHLNTLMPLLVEKTRIFLDRIKSCAKSGEPFALKNPTQDLTTDVITELTVEEDFKAQTTPEGTGTKSKFGILTSIKTMSSLTEKVGQGFQLSSYYPQRRVKEFIYDEIYTREIHNTILSKLPSTARNKPAIRGNAAKSDARSARSILNLALAGVEPSPPVLESAVAQIKTFLFAGQDTTSTTIQWMAYELSKSYPSSPLYTEHARQIRERLCEEHDTVFGRDDLFAILDVLERSDANVDDILGAKLPYTTAFVKETLRLHPPGGSARLLPQAPKDRWTSSAEEAKPYYLDIPAWTHSKTGEYHEAQKIRADGLRLYNCHYLIHRNPNVWGDDADVFDPARFLDSSGGAKAVDELEEANRTASNRSTDANDNDSRDLPHPHHISTLPVGSWRPFERGPRTCIGSNLAMMEAKIVLCVMARGFEWTKYRLDGRPDGYDRVVEDKKVGEPKKWEVWSINNVTAVPVDGMMMKVKLRQPERNQG